MELSRIKDENCPSINEITQQPPLKIKCLKGNCTLWCEKFARCLHQSDKWQKECARKFKKLFRGHRRIKMKVHAEGNQSPLHIEVKFCEWKSRYKIYTIKSFHSVSEGNGMYKVPFVLTMRSFLINNFINLMCSQIHPAVRSLDRSFALSISVSRLSIAFSLLLNLLLHLLIFFILLPRLFKLISHFSGL